MQGHHTLNQDKNKYTFDRVVRILISVGVLCGLVWLLNFLRDVLIPFAAALLLAYLMDPLVKLVQKKVKSRVAAVFLSLFAVLAVTVLLFIIIVPMITNEVRHTGQLLSSLFSNSELTQKAAQRLPPDLWMAIRDLSATKEVQDFFKNDSVINIAQSTARKVLPGVFGVIQGAANFITGLVGLSVVLLYLIFLLFDFQKVRQNWQELIPPMYQAPVVAFAADFTLAMQRYFRAQAAVAGIVGVLLAIGFQLIGLPLGILLGLFIGLLNMVPYLQILGLIPAVLLSLIHALETGSNIWIILGLTGLVFAIVQIIQDAVLVPKIMGKVTGLSPAIILLSLSIWGKLLGMFGLLIALPMTCLLWAYYKRLMTKD